MSRSESARPDTLSVPEMLRIMDVATALRQGRELVDEQLNVGELKARLKERMLAAARVTGEEVTPEEVDAAIVQYYAKLHTFREPKMGPKVVLAHLWVRRHEVLGLAGVALASVILAWWLFYSPEAMLTASGHARRQVRVLTGEIAERAEVVRKLARAPEIAPEVAGLAAEAEAFRQKGDPKGLANVRDSLATMETKLEEEYTVSVVPGVKTKSAFPRTYKDKDGARQPGYYLIVQARSPDGKVLERRIHNDEDGSYKKVNTWAERVPEAVYHRLEKDKRDDGVLNETAFAVKKKGAMDEQVTMPGADGKPLARMGQLNQW